MRYAFNLNVDEESSRSVWGLGKGVSGKPYPRLCNARRPRLEPETFRSQTVRLYRLHQAHPSEIISIKYLIYIVKYLKGVILKKTKRRRLLGC